MSIKLNHIPLGKFAKAINRPEITKSEYVERLNLLYASAKADWVFVYGDREHNGNLLYLIGFDPRFEETILLLGPGGKRFLLVGNEMVDYAIKKEVPCEVILAQSLSLPGQKRKTAPNLRTILTNCGIKKGDAVTMIGWKYMEETEIDDPTFPAFIPAIFIKIIRDIIGDGASLADGTSLLIHPEIGQRILNSANQIAVFEHSARICSEAIFNIINHLQIGKTEREMVQAMNYAGDPLTVHTMFTSGKDALIGLQSPTDKKLMPDDGLNIAVGLWGCLMCRGGLLSDSVDESLFNNVIAPYYSVIDTWYKTVDIGMAGGEIFSGIENSFRASSSIESFLNPGHHGGYEEWIHSPIRDGSLDRIASGMVFQVDIIPTPLPTGTNVNCEDTVAIADSNLRAEIKAKYPEMWKRICARRASMIESLGLKPNECILPLTDGCAYYAPFMLQNDFVCTVAP